MTKKNLTYNEYRADLLKDPEIRAAYEALEPAYQVACRRIERGITQAELAERVGTKQSGISRLESGAQDPSIALLRRIAEALDCRLEVRLVPVDGQSAPDVCP